MTRVFSITQMFLFAFLGFWLLRRLVRGYPAYVLDTDWLVRMPGALFIRFCKGPLVSLAAALDGRAYRLTEMFILTVRKTTIAARLTPKVSVSAS